MKTLSLLTLLIGVSAFPIRAEDTNTAPRIVERPQGIVKRVDATNTNVPRVATNSIATTTNVPRFQNRLQTIVRRGTNQPAPTPTSKP